MKTMRAVATCVVLTGLLGSTGCSGGASSATDGSSLVAADGPFVDCSQESRATPYTPGTVVRSDQGQFDVTLVENLPGAAGANKPPGTWTRGSNTWELQVRAASGEAAVDGLTIRAVPRMPDHGHGTSITPVTTDEGAGQYEVSPLYLYMSGYWQITLTIYPPTSDGGAATPLRNDSAVFNVCIPG
jgi:hypothetical protein